MGRNGSGFVGIGVVSAYGWGRERLWDGLVTGKPAATRVDGYGHADGGDGGWVARVPFGGEPEDGLGRFARAMRAAAREAVADAEARGWRPGRRVGLVHGVSLGETDLWKEFYVDCGGERPVRDYLAQLPSTPVAMLMKEFGFHGPAMTISAMCASGNTAVLTAKMWIDSGFADDVLVVTTDVSLTPENVAHFVRLGAAHTDTEPLDACRPFQEGSRGFVPGEASVAMIVSKQAANPYAKLLGGAITHEAFHPIRIDPGWAEIDACFAGALENAGVSGDSIRYFSAHGPGTKQCDDAEAAMVERFFRPDTGIYSTKPLTGHCQSASSMLELALAGMSYERGTILAPVPVAEAHPQLLTGPIAMEDGLVFKSALGMGGYDSGVVLAPPS